MNAYDFDKTIYDGDSTIDFYKFCVKRNPLLLRYLFRQGAGFALYLLGVYDKTAFKERFYSFLQGMNDPQRVLQDFWDLHIHRIKPWYIGQMGEDDVIISASPEFLVREAMQRLGSATVIASAVDISSGRYTGVNCYGLEKVRRFLERYPDAVIDSFYSDSNSDAPIGKIARECFLVKGDKICSVNWQ
ncbi:MAG: HAD-IB family phosphatase [Oscillospiraceae bacterium]|nr:HAD-IB family phosphatase [Oscillospiraceae bacterium]